MHESHPPAAAQVLQFPPQGEQISLTFTYPIALQVVHTVADVHTSHPSPHAVQLALVLSVWKYPVAHAEHLSNPVPAVALSPSIYVRHPGNEPFPQAVLA